MTNETNVLISNANDDEQLKIEENDDDSIDENKEITNLNKTDHEILESKASDNEVMIENNIFIESNKTKDENYDNKVNYDDMINKDRY